MTREETGAMPWEPIRRPAPLFAVALWGAWGLLSAQWIDYWFVWVGVAALALLCFRRWPRGKAWMWGSLAGIFFFIYGTATYHSSDERQLSQQAPLLPKTVFLRIVPLEEPEWKTSGSGVVRANLVARVLAMRTGAAWVPARGTIWVRLRGSALPDRLYGRVLEAGGYLEQPGPPQGPGQFDFASYLKFSGIDHVFSVHLRDCEATEEFQGASLLVWAHQLREYMKNVLQVGLDPESPWPALMAGMLFGYREGISVQLLHEFTVTGTLHLFAVSGQNVGIILIVFLFLLRIFGVIQWRWAWFFAPAILMFCLSTGMESSASRALVMILLVVAAWLLHRPVTPLNILGAAALLLWLWDPWQLFDVGFQLSFLVLLGLLVAAGPLARLAYLPWRPDVFIPRKRLPRWRLGLDGVLAKGCLLFSASLVAWLSSLPLIFTHFRLIAPITVVSNFLVVPIAGTVVVLALWAVLVSPFSLAGAGMLNILNAKLLATMTWVLGGLATVPGGHFYVAADPPAPVDGFKLTVLPGDRSAPAIYQTRSETILFGPGSARAWEYTVNPARKFLGIERWDDLFIFQANARYFGGWFDLFRMTPARDGYRFPHSASTPAYRRWEQRSSAGTAERNGFPVLQPLVRGDRLVTEEGTRIECWWPPAREADWNTENEGLILSLHQGNRVILMAGNAGESVEREILKLGFNQSVDVLIQGGHSQEPNLSLDWLKKLAPEVIVRPSPGFYPEMDLAMEKRNALSRWGIRLIEMEKSGALQIRKASGSLNWFFWDGKEKEFRP